MKRSHPFANQNGLRATRKKQVLEVDPELRKERTYWLRWLGYRFREGSEDFHELLHEDYNAWAFKVLGRAKSYMVMEPTKDYFSKAFRQASLPQLKELYAVRYIVEHPVPDGFPYTGNCTRQPNTKVVLTKVTS